MKHIIELHYNENDINYKIDIRVELNDLMFIADWYRVSLAPTNNNEEIIRSEIFRYKTQLELEIEKNKYIEKVESEYLIVTKNTHNIHDLISKQKTT